MHTKNLTPRRGRRIMWLLLIREKAVLDSSSEWQMVLCLRVVSVPWFFHQRQTLRPGLAPGHRTISERHDAGNRPGHFGRLVGGGGLSKPAVHQRRRPHVRAGYG